MELQADQVLTTNRENDHYEGNLSYQILNLQMSLRRKRQYLLIKKLFIEQEALVSLNLFQLQLCCAKNIQVLKEVVNLHIGIFQKYTFVASLLTFTAGSYMFYGLSFLQLFPTYICPDKDSCDHTDYCRDPQNVKIDWNSTRSLDNWVEKLNLACKL